MKEKYISIKLKIFIPIALLIFLSGLLIYLTILNEIKKSEVDLMKEQVINFAKSVEQSISYAMQEGKIEEINSIFKNLVGNSSIVRIRITDEKGNVLRTSSEEDKKLEMPANINSKVLIPLDENTYRSYAPIENQEKCFRCHGSRKRINGILVVDVSVRSFNEHIKKLGNSFLINSFLVFIPLFLIIILTVNWIILRPINLLKSSMSKIKDGNFKISIRYDKKDEIGEFIQAFNEMINKINDLYEEIQELHNKEMQKAGQIALVGELAAGLAHEIKNPLAGIRGAVEVLKDEIDWDNASRQILSEILLEMDRINNILNDLLTYAKPKELELSKVNLNDLISQSIKHAKNQILAKDISFIENPSAEKIYIFGDPLKLEQVFLNLFLNSIQAIKDKGIIEIGKQVKNDEVEILIKDNGEGIPEYNLPYIFKPFFTTKPKGTGLGLSLCRQIIEQHKGKIWVESQVGKGTILHISLPLWKN